MAENEQGLDAFLTPQSSEKGETVNLEDEFAKLLNDFIAQDAQKNTKASQQPVNVSTAPAGTNGGLESFITMPEQVPSNSSAGFAPETEKNSGGLDSFVTPSSNTSEGLDNFVTQPSNTPEGLDSLVSTASNTDSATNEKSLNSLMSNITISAPMEVQASKSNEQAEERELARAISNFQDGVYALADKKKLKVPQTDYTEKMLEPNYKPSVGKKIAQYMLACWDIINKYDPEHMKLLSQDANDEEYLTFAESLNDTDLQLAIISYVEILINMEICEVKYEQRREIAVKNRIKRELYEEYMELQERKNMFIQKLKEKGFPIDVENLINNYFRAAQKDAEGAFNALTKNPAMFSPIQVDKIKPKFFGLIKVTPEDGIKANQKIGEFIKKLKV